jgi:hypothetical protein
MIAHFTKKDNHWFLEKVMIFKDQVGWTGKRAADCFNKTPNIKKTLREMFPSVIIRSNNYDYLYLIFISKEDEDYFKVWASNGIELDDKV